MAIKITINNPDELLKAIKNSIDNNRIDTWSYNDKGNFTHTREQWEDKVWLSPITNSNELIFKFLFKKGTPFNKADYAILHGRFIEMLLSHFDNYFTEIISTIFIPKVI